MMASRKPARCPDCGGLHLRFARKAEQPKHFVVWKWFLVCESCGLVFQNTAWWVNPLLHLLFGIVMCVAFACYAIASTGVVGSVFFWILAVTSIPSIWEGGWMLALRGSMFEGRVRLKGQPADPPPKG